MTFEFRNLKFVVEDGKKIYLAVWHLKGEVTVCVPFEDEISSVGIAYPESLKTEYGYKDNVLSVRFGDNKQARLFEIVLK